MLQPLAPDLFVGRTAELAQLGAAEAATAGRGVIVLVAGDAGIGKTRLVAELSSERACLAHTPQARRVKSRAGGGDRAPGDEPNAEKG